MLADNYMLVFDTKADSNRRGRVLGDDFNYYFPEKVEKEAPGSVQEGESGSKLA